MGRKRVFPTSRTYVKGALRAFARQQGVIIEW